ncbi:MAG: PTS sugar transporter subunit IIC [Syntrophales bacterium]|jgi:PTS system mannose-specific IIC component|nr:PTS sugar transporter subunit IIC [Syntrophales bacterium]MDY0044323.1 PTS sugar transporter subunit IIC [Syntrophales bacterium]
MWTSIIEVALLGGIICLDRIVLQIMISRPLVCGPVVGTFLGEPSTGLITGTFLELLWMDRVPIGKYVPPNDTIAAITITASVILAGNTMGGTTPELIALAVLLLTPLAFAARKIDMLVIESNEALSKEVLQDAERGDTKAIARKQWYGMAKSFTCSAALIFLFLLVGTIALQLVFPLLTARMNRMLMVTYCFIPVVGVAVALTTIKIRGALPLFAALFLIFLAIRQII